MESLLPRVCIPFGFHPVGSHLYLIKIPFFEVTDLKRRNKNPKKPFKLEVCPL